MKPLVAGNHLMSATLKTEPPTIHDIPKAWEALGRQGGLGVAPNSVAMRAGSSRNVCRRKCHIAHRARCLVPSTIPPSQMRRANGTASRRQKRCRSWALMRKDIMGGGCCNASASQQETFGRRRELKFLRLF